MMTKGELAGAAVTWKQAHFSAVMSRSLQLPHTDSKKDGRIRKQVNPPQALTQQCLGGSAWMVLGDLFVPFRRLPFSFLGLLTSMATQVSGYTACGSTCLLNQHEAPSCLLPWYQLPPMGSYPWGLLECQSV